MNKIFRVIWNQSMQTWMAVSELSKGKAKSSSTSDVNVEVNRSDKKFWMVSVLSILSMIAVFPVWAATSTNNNIVSDNTIPNRNLAVGTATATGGTASKGASVAMGVVVNATGQDSVAVGSEVTAQHSQ